MKKKLQVIVFAFFAAFLFASVGMAQEFQVQKNENPVSASKEVQLRDEGQWIGYYDAETAGDGAVGLGAAMLFDVAVRWAPEDLETFDGWEITKIRVYMVHEPTEATAKIWQGSDEASLELMLSEPMETAENDWVEVSFDGYEINVNHWLYVGWEAGDPGAGFFPVGLDDAAAHDGYSNLALLGELGDEWDVLSAYGIGGNLVIEAYVQPVDDEDPDDTYTVTLNVDMADAVAEGGVEFDPAIHDVWVTGTFADWATPGENADFQMHPADRVSKDVEVLYEEHFSPATEDGSLPDGWEQKKADNALGNDLQDLEEDDTNWFRYSELFYFYDNFNPNWVHTEDASMHINWNVEAEQNVYAITPEIELPEADEITLEFWMFFTSVGTWHTLMDVLIHIDGEWEVLAEFSSATDANQYDAPVHIDLTGRTGTARIAFVYKWNDGVQMNIDAIKITAATDNGEEPEEQIYTITFEAEPGDHMYKYFLVEDDPTWGLGEWPDDPNRELHVDQDMEVNDVFGVQPDPVEEFTVTFEIEDEDGNAIEDAIVTFDGHAYDAGHYVIDGVEEGTYDYMVVKEGFETVAETISVTEDKTVEVILVEEVLEPEEYVYSIAIQLPAGEYEYKYFLVVDDPTWELGEWVGDPNRSVMVDAEMTVQDMWGEQPGNDNGDPTKEGHDEYIVTFEVTIEEGTLVGDIAFDPEEHHIFIAGSFPGEWEWNEPGSNPLFELTTTDDDPIVSAPDISTVDVAVNIFPNPASDLFHIESDAQISEIRMFDVLGQVIYVNEPNDTHHAIRVGGMNAGVYFVQITTQAGIVTQRVQVTR